MLAGRCDGGAKHDQACRCVNAYRETTDEIEFSRGSISANARASVPRHTMNS